MISRIFPLPASDLVVRFRSYYLIQYICVTYLQNKESNKRIPSYRLFYCPINKNASRYQRSLMTLKWSTPLSPIFLERECENRHSTFQIIGILVYLIYLSAESSAFSTCKMLNNHYNTDPLEWFPAALGIVTAQQS